MNDLKQLHDTYDFVTDSMKNPASVLRVTANLKIYAVRPMPILTSSVSEQIDSIWTNEQHRLNGRLFNGRVFSADIITPDLICGHWTEFRRIVAQMRFPGLHGVLGIRPLAVGGVIEGPDGFIFGRRPQHSVYQGGEWQLPPAGSVDSSAARDEGRVDVLAMFLTELREELGMDLKISTISGRQCWLSTWAAM